MGTPTEPEYRFLALRPGGRERSLFATANTLHALVEMTRRGAAEGGSAEQAMAQLVAEIKNAHATAFGIELEWPKRDFRCPNDTDGDGNCHLCHRTGGCPH